MPGRISLSTLQTVKNRGNGNISQFSSTAGNKPPDSKSSAARASSSLFLDNLVETIASQGVTLVRLEEENCKLKYQLKETLLELQALEQILNNTV